MEQINRIEIQGRIGSCLLRRTGDTNIARFTLGTTALLNDSTEVPVVETTWFNVMAVENDSIRNLEGIRKGQLVHVTGRAHWNRYTDQDGAVKYSMEVIAKEVEQLD